MTPVQGTEPTIGGEAPQGGPSLAPRRMGRYVLLEELGRGGMGAVYAAYDPELDRKVAIKLLADGLGDEHRRARLLREAQALARLAHPNVVAVHDVGVLDGQVYVAMEYIQGQSLRRWLATRRRWPEIVDLFVQAGRGLAAAHAVGLVHRDIKPENVMVSADGRVRVLDFGLAALAAEAEPAAPPRPRPADDERPIAEAATELSTEPRDLPVLGASLLSSRLTVEGARMGTLAYMSPEQFAARELGPASDQFSFAVALYEALYGQRPFAGETTSEYAAAVCDGVVRPPPRGGDVPRWLFRLLGRALAVDPRARFPDMPALIGELARDRGRARRRLLAFGGTALVAGAVAAAVVAAQPPAEARCSGAASQLAGAWDEARRDAVERAFAATGLSYARDSAARVAAQLDDLTARWAEAHAETCRSNLCGELSDALLDRQMTCLKGQLRGIVAHVEVLARADAAAVERAIEAVDALPPPSDCTDPDRLLPERLVPVDPRDAAAVAAQRERLAEGEAELAAGHYDVAGERFDAVVAAAAELGDAALRAEALYLAGLVHDARGEHIEARARWLDGYWAALAVEHREYELSLALVLLALASDENVDPREGALWRGTASALIRVRGAERTEEQVQLLQARAMLASIEQERDEAERLALAAVALSTELFGPEALRTGHARGTAGRILRANGKPDAALREYTAARDIMLARFGPDHPSVAPAMNNLAAVLDDLGRLGEAEAAYLEARRVIEASIGPDAPALGYIDNNLSDLYTAQGRFPEAVAAAERALARFEREFGPEHPRTALTLSNLGVALLLDRRAAEAAPYFLRSQAVYEKALGADHYDVGFALHGLAAAYLATGRPELAEPLFRRSLALTEAARGPEHVENAPELLGLGQTLLARGRPREALAPLERALDLWRRDPRSGERVGEARFFHARAQWEAGLDRAQARRAAERALGELEGVPRVLTRPQDVAAWLAEHPEPRERRAAGPL